MPSKLIGVTGETRPRVRPELEFGLVEAAEQPFVVVRDPEGIVAADRLAPGALAVIQFLDGERNVAEIHTALVEQGADGLTVAQVEGFVQQLSELLLLEGPHLEHARAQREAWLAAPVRPASHADAAYPSEPDETRSFLDAHLALAEEVSSRPLRRLIAPHIDLRLGAEIHGFAHRRLAASGRPDVVVVLGVCHQPAEAAFIACRKDFETPGGIVRHDTAFIDALEERFGESLTVGELVHAQEHSVEFQALWIAHHWPDDPPTMVPLLVRGFHDQMRADATPRDDEEVERFIAALRGAIADDERDIVVIASVDLAHMGPIYDDRAGLDEQGERRLAEADGALLDAMVANDADRFFGAIAADGNARQICGVAPIYLTLRLGEGEGELLKYGQGRIDPDSGSVVSYAAVAFSD